MKLVIQIPCLNEEATLPGTLADIPSTVPGFDRVETLVIDDGSTDDTSGAAERGGADRILQFASHRGLARAFERGLNEALAMGADVIVNTDGDNQYRGADIPRLVAPILACRADIVIGVRDIDSIREFSRLKKPLQRIGSRLVGRLSGCPVSDAPSGFRAFHRDAARALTFRTSFSHTLETLMQARPRGLRVSEVPIRTNPRTRESRLFRNSGEYLVRSAVSLVHLAAVYRPFRS